MKMLLRLLMTCALLAVTYAGVTDRLKESINQYHQVTVNVPERLANFAARGLWQDIRNSITNGSQFTLRVPPIPLISNLWRRNSTLTTKTSNNETSSSSTSLEADQSLLLPAPTGTDALTTYAMPMKTANKNSDWCGGTIFMDLQSGKELTYKSTEFPQPRSTPYACSWDVKVSKNCRRGLITIKMDARSRLAQEDRCTRGYFRISPFMKEAKICGQVGSVPPFQWFVDDLQHPEDVSIIMKNIGLNDGSDEGIGFTLSGECLSAAVKKDVTIGNVDFSSRWMQSVLSESDHGKPNGVNLYAAEMAFIPNSKLSASAAEKISNDLIQAVPLDKDESLIESSSDNVPLTTASASPEKKPIITLEKKPSKITFYSPLYLLFRRLNLLNRFGFPLL